MTRTHCRIVAGARLRPAGRSGCGARYLNTLPPSGRPPRDRRSTDASGRTHGGDDVTTHAETFLLLPPPPTTSLPPLLPPPPIPPPSPSPSRTPLTLYVIVIVGSTFRVFASCRNVTSTFHHFSGRFSMRSPMGFWEKQSLQYYFFPHFSPFAFRNFLFTALGVIIYS